MQTLALCSVIVLAFVGSGRTVAAATHRPVSVAFLHPIALPSNPDISTNFRFGLFYGRVAAVRGLDLTAFVARTDQGFRGLQIAGVHSWTGGPSRGFTFTAGVNFVGGDVGGLQLAGLANFDRGDFNGIQAASLFNFVEGQTAGIQLSSVYNMCEGDLRWLQLSSILNATAGSLAGVQAGSINFTFGRMHGVQLGFGNAAGEVAGVQAGFANFAGAVHGTQIGLWNKSRRIDGVPVGVVNLSNESGSHDWVAYASSYAAINVGLRTTVSGWSSMLTVGASDLEEERGDTVFFGWHYGQMFDVSSTWQFGADVGFVHVIPRPSDEAGVNDDLHFAIEPRLLVERTMGPRWRLFGGAGMSGIASEYSSEATVDYTPLGLVGIALE